MSINERYKMLLCPPKYFDVVYSINPWMDINKKINKKKSHTQWKKLHNILKRLGVKIDLIDPVKGLPDMVFAGDAGIVYKNKFISSNFKYKERRPESIYYKKWFKSHNYKVIQLPKNILFEGMGDIVFHKNRAISAYGIRSSKKSTQYVKKYIPELKFIGRELKLVDPLFFHLGYALAILDEETIMYVPSAFSKESCKIIENLTPNIIKITEKEDLENAAVNTIVINRNLIMHKCSQKLKNKLKKLGFNIIECDVSEFLKAGGSVRCLVLYL